MRRGRGLDERGEFYPREFLHEPRFCCGQLRHVGVTCCDLSYNAVHKERHLADKKFVVSSVLRYKSA